jgi:hypothetical protein
MTRQHRQRERRHAEEQGGQQQRDSPVCEDEGFSFVVGKTWWKRPPKSRFDNTADLGRIDIIPFRSPCRF